MRFLIAFRTRSVSPRQTRKIIIKSITILKMSIKMGSDCSWQPGNSCRSCPRVSSSSQSPLLNTFIKVSRRFHPPVGDFCPGYRMISQSRPINRERCVLLIRIVFPDRPMRWLLWNRTTLHALIHWRIGSHICDTCRCDDAASNAVDDKHVVLASELIDTYKCARR